MEKDAFRMAFPFSQFFRERTQAVVEKQVWKVVSIEEVRVFA